MVISGFMLITKKGETLAVIQELKQLSGVEIHDIIDEIKIIMTLEAVSLDESYLIGEKIEAIDGVSSICLAYTNFEEEPTEEISEPGNE